MGSDCAATPQARQCAERRPWVDSRTPYRRRRWWLQPMHSGRTPSLLQPVGWHLTAPQLPYEQGTLIVRPARTVTFSPPTPRNASLGGGKSEC
jgi:hypothetical protein